MQKTFFLLFLLSIISAGAFAEVRLPAVIGSHMVLQQKTAVALWGWCEPGEQINIKVGWDTTTYTATGTSGAKWQTMVKTPAAGGPYTITISGHNTIKLEDVLIGEVWLCSGQSNMEMNIGWGIKRYEEEVSKATNKSIRFFHIPRATALHPQEDVKGARWVVCSPEMMKTFSAVGYFFGAQLQPALGAPVGLINVSWGGTPAEVWTPEQIVKGDSVLATAATKIKSSAHWPVTPGATYNAMIHPLVNYAVAGALWYQGESNVGTADTYQQLLMTMINTWRQLWQKELPFYFVQIAPFEGYGKMGQSANLLREAQTKVQQVPNTGMVVTSDLVDDIKDIHPHNKKDVGQRLAQYALAQTYGKKGVAYKSPQYKNMKVEKGKIRISFDGAEDGLVSKGGAPTDFYIAGDDQKFVPAVAKIEGSTVVVWNNSVKKPAAVRFGFTNAAMPNLFGKGGLPVNLFRTDNWNVETAKADK